MRLPSGPLFHSGFRRMTAQIRDSACESCDAPGYVAASPRRWNDLWRSLRAWLGLRAPSSGRTEVRLLFAFGPEREAIFLVAGDKSGQWDTWYGQTIPVADERFEEHLQTLKRPGVGSVRRGRCRCGRRPRRPRPGCGLPLRPPQLSQLATEAAEGRLTLDTRAVRLEDAPPVAQQVTAGKSGGPSTSPPRPDSPPAQPRARWAPSDRSHPLIAIWHGPLPALAIRRLRRAPTPPPCADLG
jgi:hypothetical protein